MRLTFLQGVTTGPGGRTIVSLPGGFEPDSLVMVITPISDRSEPPSAFEFEEIMLNDQDNFEKGVINEDRVEAMRVLDVTLDDVPDNPKFDIDVGEREVEALVVELTSSLSPEEAKFISDRLKRELKSRFTIDTFNRIIQ